MLAITRSVLRKKTTLPCYKTMFFLSLDYYVRYCWIQQWKNISREDSENGTEMIKGKECCFMEITPDRQGLKVDVSITRENIHGENILVANPRTLGKKHLFKPSSFIFRTENKLTKLIPPIEHCRKGRGGKDETV